jgi:hypothetical protein
MDFKLATSVLSKLCKRFIRQTIFIIQSCSISFKYYYFENRTLSIQQMNSCFLNSYILIGTIATSVLSKLCKRFIRQTIFTIQSCSISFKYYYSENRTLSIQQMNSCFLNSYILIETKEVVELDI